tara:strand:+ start:204 stop:641 length:438 start_codon:yes stop_codon:yes gene_type:complete
LLPNVDIGFHSSVKIQINFIFFINFIQDHQLFFVKSTLGVVVLEGRSERTTDERKGQHSDKHQENTKYLLNFGTYCHVSIPNSCNRSDREVNRCQILLSWWHFDNVTFHPSSFCGFFAMIIAVTVELSLHHPKASHNVDKEWASE